MRKLALIRGGHMGDVLLTEPVARVLRRDFDQITFFTDYPHVAELMDVFDDVRAYSDRPRSQNREFDRVLELVYEIYPGTNHLQGYARCAGIELETTVPRIRCGHPRVVDRPYGLIAPDTSFWIRRMRQWPRERFDELAARLERAFGFPFLVLGREPFAEMLSLIEHCQLFVGNDSGPAVLAQCFDRPTFVICGATKPELVLVHPAAVGVISDVGCNGCKHYTRHTHIECLSPICLDTLTVDAALTEILAACGPVAVPAQTDR